MLNRIKRKIHRRIQKYIDARFTDVRCAKLNNTDFSIICNNCWGGFVYRRFGLPYLSPTMGLYIFPEDFIKLCLDLKKYMSLKLEFIPYTESRYKDIIERRNQTDVPIARLGDIEIVFLHYPTPEEAADKWYRRASRINYDNLIFKFGKMNGCTDEHLRQFDELDVAKKVLFVPKNCETDAKCAVHLKDAIGEEISDDTHKYASYIDLVKLINSKKVSGNRME